MDSFISTYLFLLIIVVVSLLLFWGGVIYFMVRIWRSNSGLSDQQKLGILTKVTQALSGRRPSSEPGPNETTVRGWASREGIDLDK